VSKITAARMTFTSNCSTGLARALFKSPFLKKKATLMRMKIPLVAMKIRLVAIKIPPVVVQIDWRMNSSPKRAAVL